MNALWKLEKGGIRFELTAEGEITYENTWPNVAGRADLTRDWAAPLLDALRRDRDELVIILMARREWMSVYDEWSDLLEEGMDDIERDVAYLERMQDLAISGQLGCYDGDDVDLGAAGWELVTERLIRSIRQTADDRRQTADDRRQKEYSHRGQATGGALWSVVRGPWSDLSTDTNHKEKQEMGIKIEQTTYDAVPTGEYKAVITEIVPAEGKFGPQLQIKSEINDGPYAGNTFLCWVSPKFSPKSRLFEWVEAALAMPVPKSYTFDSDHLIGREVVATLVVRELDGGGEVNRVDRVRAVVKG